MAKQTTRLDRLLLLLDTGSAAATRRTAAEQIGELSAQLEGGAPNLLARVRRLLRSKNWETRVAAANAVDAICKRMPVWDPSSCLKMEDATENGGKTADPLIFQGLERLDIKGVIERGQILVCSTGTEFDDVTDGILDPKERLAARKQQLRAALGLDNNANLVATKKGDTDIYNMQDTVKDEDVEQMVKEVPQTKGQASNKRKAADILDDMQGEPAAGAAEHGLEHLSARERNQLRRKQRKVQRDSKEAAAMGAAEESRNGSKAVVTSQPQDANKVVVESAVAEVVATDPNEWPLGPLCDDLSHDIFDACWEVRHGAAMSLRDILKYHAPAAGKWGGCSKEQQAVDNQVWLEECCIRMLCVLSLDRFGDYVSDPVVAPVRETCAQALGVLLRSLSASCLGHVTRVMQNMQTVADWEVRHGGMLGLKYLIAVRKECIVDEHLHTVLPLMRAAIEGEDDDVRAVAAEALLPLASHMVIDSTCFEWFGKALLALLWATLEQLDDLTASTAAVMGLIAEMAQHLPSHAAADIGGGTSSDAGLLMQRLYPFFRHSMTSVRRSVLKIAGNLAVLCFKAVQTSSSSSNWLLPRLADTLHRVFLNIILEQRPDILASSHLLWDQLLCVAEGHALSHAVAGKIKVWLQAVATPPGHALDQTELIGTLAKSKACEASERKRALAVARARDSGSGGSALALAVRPDQDADADQGLTNLDDLSASVQMRLSGVRAMGALAWRLQATDGDQTTMLATITALLSAQLGTHTQVGALILAEWAMAASTSTSASYTLPPNLQSMLDAKLETIGQGDYPYLEIGNLSTKWRQELRLLLEDYKVAGIKEAGQVLSANKSDLSALTIMEALKLAQEATEWEARVKSKEKNPQKAGKESADKAKRRSNACRQVFVTIGQLQEVQANLHTSVLAAVGEVLVAARNLPPKIAPVIRALMDSLQRESNLDLQRRSAKAMVGLLRLRPNGKVVSNLATYLCEDPTFTPQCSDAPEELERVSMEDLTYLPAADDVVIAATDDAQREARIKKRGATMALQEIARGFGAGGDSSASAFAALPALSARIKDPLVAVFGHVEDGSVLHLEVPKMQELVDALQLARTLAAAVGAEDLKALTALMPLAVRALESKHAPLRQMAARFLSEMCCVDALAGMEIVIRRVLPLLADAANTARRLGATETLYKIITVMDMKVLPYAIFFVDPILGRMSDQHAAVRQTVTKTFATLLRLLPLEAGIPDPEGLSADLVAEKAEKRRFLEQLLDTSKIDNFEIPVKIAADLRRYQQEGVNWMSFMLKYQLHGILCDDMGLGKTLQSICIMASDHHNRRKHFAATRDPAYAPFPSLIVCPPTLVGHWAFEISKFLPDKTLGTAVQFVGSPAERGGLRERVSSGGDCVVITSYDTLRNDIAFLGNFNWNYCVLDEGHVIKNGKSKTTQAVKTVKANHRLLLSGTPIQNNALELWSLFDFLMPGFLGTEKSFSQLYSKPILASRNAKCTSRESEAGALALEALHRQVPSPTFCAPYASSLRPHTLVA